MALKHPRWSLVFATADEARAAIRAGVYATYFVSAINLILGLSVFPSALWDAFVGAGFGLWLQLRRSKAAALVILLYFGTTIFLTTLARFGGGKGGRNVLLAVVVFLVALQASVAAFKLAHLAASEAQADRPDHPRAPMD